MGTPKLLSVGFTGSDLGHSSDAIAESAVAQLRNESARLIGCIVADVDGAEQK